MCWSFIFWIFKLVSEVLVFFSIIFIGTWYTIKGCTAWTSQGKKAVILFLFPWAGQQGKPVGSFLHSRNSPGHPNPQITATAYLTFYGPGRQASEGLVAPLSAAPGPRGDSSPAAPPAWASRARPDLLSSASSARPPRPARQPRGGHRNRRWAGLRRSAWEGACGASGWRARSRQRGAEPGTSRSVWGCGGTHRWAVAGGRGRPARSARGQRWASGFPSGFSALPGARGRRTGRRGGPSEWPSLRSPPFPLAVLPSHAFHFSFDFWVPVTGISRNAEELLVTLWGAGFLLSVLNKGCWLSCGVAEFGR